MIAPSHFKSLILNCRGPLCRARSFAPSLDHSAPAPPRLRVFLVSCLLVHSRAGGGGAAASRRAAAAATAAAATAAAAAVAAAGVVVLVRRRRRVGGGATSCSFSSGGWRRGGAAPSAGSRGHRSRASGTRGRGRVVNSRRAGGGDGPVPAGRARAAGGWSEFPPRICAICGRRARPRGALRDPVRTSSARRGVAVRIALRFAADLGRAQQQLARKEELL